VSITIRQALPGDEQAIVDLVREFAAEEEYPTAIDEHYARHFLASPVGGVLLAWEDDAVVGLVSYAMVPGLFHAADSGFIETLFVTAPRRAAGVGRRLMQAVLKLLEDAGCAEISVSTGAGNEVAQKLYFDLGLTEASVLLEKHIQQ
jgi:GNAT superfamily N-acetyltransferase